LSNKQVQIKENATFEPKFTLNLQIFALLTEVIM